MNRIVQPELLDDLPPEDRVALRSRRDIRRLNALMSHPRIAAQALRDSLNGSSAPGIVELGAGDGHFLWNVARHLQGHWPSVNARLVDRLDVFDPQLRDRFARVGWRVQPETAEVIQWLRQPAPHPADAVVSNLFLHHFDAGPLAELLRLAARSARVVIAIEPRRSAWVYFCSRLLWLMGCSSVTRHDGPVSIQAGFAGRELTALWPETAGWDIVEQPAGLFSHLFIARRRE